MTPCNDKASSQPTLRYINFPPLIRTADFIAAHATSSPITYYLRSSHHLARGPRNSSTSGFVLEAKWTIALTGSSHDREVERLAYRRREVIGPCELYLADCAELLPRLALVDHCITDPPYSEQTHKGARSLHHDGTFDVGFIDFSSISETDLIAAVGQFLSVTKRWLIFTCEWQFASGLKQAFPDEFIRLGAWVKPNGAPQYTGDRPSTGWEAVVIMHRKGRKRWNGGGHHATWIENIVTPGTNVHPTQKPVALVSDWIKKFTDPGDIILDPYMGSGTTLYCAMKLGRMAIGIEADEKHYENAVKRLQAVYAQGDLFIAPAAPARQEVLL